MILARFPDLLALFVWQCLACGHWNLGHIDQCTGVQVGGEWHPKCASIPIGTY